METKSHIEKTIENLQSSLPGSELDKGELIFRNNDCQILTQSSYKFELIVDTQFKGIFLDVTLKIDDDNVLPYIEDEPAVWDSNTYACLLQVQYEMQFLDPKIPAEHKKYTRNGMIKRVLAERRQKAETANYTIKWAANIYGDHILTNENGVKYRIFLRNFENETGYSDSMDSRLNKLGTTKHIMFAFKALKENKSLFNSKSKKFPFIEIFCDPLNDYKISWFYPYELPLEEKQLIIKFFGREKCIENDQCQAFLEFIQEASMFNSFRIRTEVSEKVEAAFEAEVLEYLRSEQKIDFSILSADLYPYQQEGIEFAAFRKAAIIADEMGLGKTLQAIGTAIVKKKIFGFSKTLVVTPASLKEQWKKEIEKFTDEKALVVDGLPDDREKIYRQSDHFFYIVNYETVLRDRIALSKAGFDFVILDEAQRIKNFETKTASSISKLQFKHVLVITGTPIENRLIDIYSIVNAIQPNFFGPLWEFSYQHCLFDPEKHNKINGYYDLQKLNKRLESILIRREKRKVLDQLPNVVQMNVPFNLSPLQSEYHTSYAMGLASILRKKFLTPYDLQKLQLLLSSMRMVCDSTYLIDDQTNESPKLDELKYMLLEKLDVKNSESKIIIFSEWVKVHKLIGQMLRENNIGFAELNGSVPVKMRGELIRKFETNPQCKIFLSTEAGGSGLNLQMADTLINFELPWNPAKKNQRIGRIDRIGQKSGTLTIYNFITRRSIEDQIASGLLVKQSLFDGVLDSSNRTNFVDFSSKGRSQFIEQLELFITKLESTPVIETETDYEQHVVPETGELLTDLLSREVADDSIADTFVSEPVEIEEPVTSESHSASDAKAVEIEQVMNSGMQFLAGLFKMSTGKDLGIDQQTIEVNRQTGEVVMKFKLPF
jgi:SNF2 family DNA or RNA helicase